VRGARVIDEFLSPRFRRFLLAGGLAACVNVGSRMVFDHFMPYAVAIALAYCAGMATAYTLTRKYVFNETQRAHSEASLRFVIVNVLGFAQTWVVSIGLGDYAFPSLGLIAHAHDLAHLIGVGTPVITSFIAHRYWTFG
jgi:putative flippase GtrA